MMEKPEKPNIILTNPIRKPEYSPFKINHLISYLTVQKAKAASKYSYYATIM